MELKRVGSQASMKGPEEYFTGTVRIDPLSAPPPPARVSCASVTFEPGARSAWHTHPLGQTLIVTAGCGWTQCEGEAKVEIRAGDVIWCPPGHKHWHGATATTAMTPLRSRKLCMGLSSNGWKRLATRITWAPLPTQHHTVTSPLDRPARPRTRGTGALDRGEPGAPLTYAAAFRRRATSIAK